MTADQDQAAAGTRPEDTRQVFRSSVVRAVWWVWVAFAVANLIDLAVQGRDHISLVAALILILITGVMYVAAWRPRIIADDAALTIVNPLRDHRIGWAAVSGVDMREMLRVRCEWAGGQRTVYAWAINTSRRRQVTAQLRADRRARPRRGGFGSGAGGGLHGGLGSGYDAPADGFGAPRPAPATRPDPNEAGHVVAALNAHADEAPAASAARPLSTWRWQAFAAIGVPALALVIAILL
ncbi:MAG TPA: PH domain-containing protein [Trebonia sp.]|nr:PH domain-containing protein [Trebonia sp.]